VSDKIITIAGETIELAARHLLDANAKRILVANRTLEHAQQLAHRFGLRRQA